MRFASLGSGSEGNGLVVEVGDTRVLIDCGFAVRDTVARLARLGVAAETISAVLVTHELADHIGGVAAFAARYRVPVWLTFGTLEAASALMEKIESLRQRFEHEELMLEHLLLEVRRIKSELELMASSEKVSSKHLAEDLAQWLTVWLQNPQIFPEWLALRRATPEFQQRFEL